VPRNFAGCNENCIKTTIADVRVRICREPDFSGGGDSAALPLIDRLGGILKGGARFNFHKDQKMAPARDDVDFANRAAPRRARMRNPLAIRKAAARLSAEIPRWNAA